MGPIRMDAYFQAVHPFLRAGRIQDVSQPVFMVGDQAGQPRKTHVWKSDRSHAQIFPTTGCHRFQRVFMEDIVKLPDELLGVRFGQSGMEQAGGTKDHGIDLEGLLAVALEQGERQLAGQLFHWFCIDGIPESVCQSDKGGLFPIAALLLEYFLDPDGFAIEALDQDTIQHAGFDQIRNFRKPEFTGDAVSILDQPLILSEEGGVNQWAQFKTGQASAVLTKYRLIFLPYHMEDCPVIHRVAVMFMLIPFGCKDMHFDMSVPYCIADAEVCIGKIGAGMAVINPATEEGNRMASCGPEVLLIKPASSPDKVEEVLLHGEKLKVYFWKKWPASCATRRPDGSEWEVIRILSRVFFLTIQVHVVFDDDLGHVFAFAIFILPLAVVEFAGDGDLFAFVEAGGHAFGERAPGDEVVPGGGGDKFPFRVFVGFVGGQTDTQELFAGRCVFQFGILSEVTDQLDAIN